MSIQSSPIEIERAAQRLLALLEVGGAKARYFETPFGPTERNLDLVRQSLAALRVADQRMLYAILTEIAVDAETETGAPSQPWPMASRAIGWHAPWP